MLKTGRDIPLPFMQIDPTAKKNKKTGEQIGYNPKTSELDNIANKGGYEKTLDKAGNTLILRGGDKKEISRAKIGTKQEEAMRKEYSAKKAFTEGARTRNFEFLDSREKTGKTVK
jgi:hypothetical protein